MRDRISFTQRASSLSSQAVLVGLLAFALPGCDVATHDANDDAFSASGLSAYNYTTEGIQEFYLDGAWGSGVGIGGGGGVVCCVSLPRKWHPDVITTIEWRRSDCGKGVDENGWSNCRNDPANPTRIIKKTIPIEPYETPGRVQVMFLPDDNVKIYVRDDDPWAHEHPSHLGAPRPLTTEQARSLLTR